MIIHTSLQYSILTRLVLQLCAFSDNPPTIHRAQAGDIFFEWLLNDVVIHSGLGTNLELSIPSVTFDNEGRYSCRATLGDTSVIMATSGGELFVFGECNELFIIHGTLA